MKLRRLLAYLVISLLLSVIFATAYGSSIFDNEENLAGDNFGNQYSVSYDMKQEPALPQDSVSYSGSSSTTEAATSGLSHSEVEDINRFTDEPQWANPEYDPFEQSYNTFDQGSDIPNQNYNTFNQEYDPYNQGYDVFQQDYDAFKQDYDPFQQDYSTGYANDIPKVEITPMVQEYTPAADDLALVDNNMPGSDNPFADSAMLDIPKIEPVVSDPFVTNEGFVANPGYTDADIAGIFTHNPAIDMQNTLVPKVENYADTARIDTSYASFNNRDFR